MYSQIRSNKYNASKSFYNGYWYQSKLEAGYAQELDLRVKAKDIKSWERQVRVSLDVNGYHITNYIVDFKVLHNDDTIEWVECKGMETAEWVLKRKLFEALIIHGKANERYTVVKQSSVRIGRGQYFSPKSKVFTK